MKNYLMKIKLESALCIGSGYSYAGIIDSDICYDDYGLPYIPAKRIKGCMREVAEGILHGILKHKTNEIFGKGGNSKNIGFSISNAHITGSSSLRHQIRSVLDERLSVYAGKQNILEQYTCVKAQTAMKDGVACNNSLRYARIVNQMDPVTGDPLVFVAEITCEDDISDDLELIVKGLRNIGIMRNRGLGSVSCKLEEVPAAESVEVQSKNLNSDMCCIRFMITNIEPLMISTDRDEMSEKYIPGQNVIGMMAARYLSIPGNTSEDKAFKDLFLNGKTIYKNVYPCVDGISYYPAPAFINRLKKTKELVNVEAANSQDDEDNKDGNQPKKLKGKYLAEIEGVFSVHEVPMRIIYHHNHRDELLYSHQVIAENQKFCGSIIAPAGYVDILTAMLNMGDLYFGKSKSAQYGQCKIDEITISEYSPAKKEIKAGEEILIVLRSDAIISNENGYTVAYDDVITHIEKRLGITADSDELKSFSIIQTKKVYGYNSKWNLRKQPLIAVEAGSVYAMKLAEDAEIKSDFIGERNLEGYGEVDIVPVNKFGYILKEKTEVTYAEPSTVIGDELKNILKNIVVGDIKEKTIWKAIAGDNLNKKVKISGISDSLRGRITLMLAESMDKFKRDDQWRDRCEDFIKRIDSIDRKMERERIKRSLENEMFVFEKGCIGISEQYFYSYGGDAVNILKDRLGFSDEEVADMVRCLWSDVLMAILVNDKYMKGDN